MHLKSRVILGAATAATAIAAALIPTTSAFAAPAVTVTWPGGAQGFGAQNGTTVNAAGSGFKPSSTVYVVECSDIKTASNCDLGTAKVGQTDANGAFSVDIPVHTGTVGDGTCNAGAGTTAATGSGATSPPPCYIVASTDQTGQDLAQAGAGPLIFDRLQVAPRTGLKSGQNVNITGGGFKPSSTVYVSECTSADPSKATTACDFNHIKTVPTDASGGFATTTFMVHTGTVGSDNVQCKAGGNCIVAGTDNALNPSNGNIGGAVIAFAAVKPLSVSAHASVKHVAKGKSFKVIGKATSGGAGVAGLNAVLDKVVNGSLQKVASVKTVSGGAVTFKLTQKKTTTYKVVIASQKGYAKASSKTFKVATP
jgi:hypothetical protein